ncbi:MAG: hypothetical protein IID38_08705 [Planctomycetes bacterium]|nr:hypothetical protein [Planctomycetota bacterium]
MTQVPPVFRHDCPYRSGAEGLSRHRLVAAAVAPGCRYRSSNGRWPRTDEPWNRQRTDDLIDASAAFVGNLDNGQTLYDSGIGTGTSCVVCHGADGLLAPPGADPDEHDEFVGLIANENPWEFQHKVRFGQPGTAMSASVADGGTTQDVADLGAYAQSLPEAPEDDGNGVDGGNGGDGDNGNGVDDENGVDGDSGAAGDPAVGEAFFVANNCGACHCADAIGGCALDAPSLVGEGSTDILDRLTGVMQHTGGTVEGAAQQDADDLAAWLASL